MIVITGPGRSGTSFLASLAHQLGFDVGGGWSERLAAGREAGPIVQVNDEIIRELGAEGLWRMQAVGERRAVERRLAAAGKGMPRALRGPAGTVVRRLLGTSLARDRSGLRWDDLDSVTARHRDRLRALAAEHEIVKDPRFGWTLPVWVAAGAAPSHVLVSLRDLSAMVGSRERAEPTLTDASAARNAIVYSVGLCLTTLYDAGIEHSVVRFPDFLSDPSKLHAAMRFPTSVPVDEFTRAFESVKRDDAVHDWR